MSLTAESRPVNWLVRFVVLLDQVAGIAVLLAAAWLVWTKPGVMSWGFFLYVIWFNPGQAYEFYAQLQRWPILVLAQNALGSVSQAAGYVGLLAFVMRAPTGVLQPEWQRAERMLPVVGAGLAVVLMSAYGSSFGFHTELLSRIAILSGILVSAVAVTILLLRRKTLSPKDNQRLRWVMWGCLIGLPAFVIADLNEYTTLLTDWDGLFLPEDVAGLLYLVNGILCLFVVEAVRRQRVVNVAIPLRRVTVLALMTSLPRCCFTSKPSSCMNSSSFPAGGGCLSARSFSSPSGGFTNGPSRSRMISSIDRSTRPKRFSTTRSWKPRARARSTKFCRRGRAITCAFPPLSRSGGRRAASAGSRTARAGAAGHRSCASGMTISGIC